MAGATLCRGRVAGLQRLKDLDWPLLLFVTVSCALGLAAIAGASGGSGPHDPLVLALIKRQAWSLAIGAAVGVVLTLVDYHLWTRWWHALYGLSVALLLAVMVIGRSTHGSQRWLTLGPFELQPSEVAKLALIICLAGLLAGQVGHLRRFRDLVLPCGSVVLPAALVVVEPDLGTSLVFGAILIGMVFAAGFPIPKLVAALFLIVALGAGLVLAHLRWPGVVPLPLHSYQLQRLLAFLNPEASPQKYGYQYLQSEMAVGSGRITGNGLFSGGAGGQLAYMPEADSDFIFATVGDTMGFVGSVAVLVSLALIVWRVVACMAAARDALGALLAAGIACMLGFEMLLNVGVTLGLMPVTGVPLPFTSYGGSAALVNLASVGLVQSIRLRRRRVAF